LPLLSYFVEPPIVPLLVPPTPGLLGEVVLPVPELVLPVPVPELVLPVPEVLLPVLEGLLELPVLLRSWRRQSSFAMPVRTSQRLELLELAPEELLGLALVSEVELLLVSLGFVVALPGVGLVGDVPVLGLLGLVVELLPLGLLGLVWAMERLAAPRNAAATAA